MQSPPSPTPSLPPELAWIAALPPDAQDKLLAEIERRLQGRKLELYAPYPKQILFHEAGATFRERLLSAGNRLGKTYSAGAEAAYHLTGRYPEWWRGKSFKHPTFGAAASETGLLTRDGVQRILFGHPATPMGTGLVPADAIKEVFYSKFGPSHLIEMARLRWGGGGDVQAQESVYYQRSYDQGRARIQAMDLHWFWMDEEPDEPYYMEALTRTNLHLGPVFLTFTPLKGMSNVVKRFYLDKMPGTIVVQMSIEDALHIPADVREKIIATYPEHEREARVHGVPQLGKGRVFTIPEDQISFDSFPIPAHWPRIVGVDFGSTHPTAAVWLAWDRDTDTVYVYDCYRVKGGKAPEHAAALRGRGQWIPVAWPQDGLNETSAGPQIAQQYRDAGVNMLPEFAKWPVVNDRTQENTIASRTSVEAGVHAMFNRFLEGKLKIAKHLQPIWEEYRFYHRDEQGKLVKDTDDALCAIRYALMCLDKAITPPRAGQKLNPHRSSNWRAA
jgi:phage terminase large subunit-like protein